MTKVGTVVEQTNYDSNSPIMKEVGAINCVCMYTLLTILILMIDQKNMCLNGLFMISDSE